MVAILALNSVAARVQRVDPVTGRQQICQDIREDACPADACPADTWFRLGKEPASSCKH